MGTYNELDMSSFEATVPVVLLLINIHGKIFNAVLIEVSYSTRNMKCDDTFWDMMILQVSLEINNHHLIF